MGDNRNDWGWWGREAAAERKDQQPQPKDDKDDD